VRDENPKRHETLRPKRRTREKGGEYWMEKTKEGNENETEMSDDGEKKNDEMPSRMTKNEEKRNNKEREKDEMLKKMMKKKSNRQT
jgi:hypothetical protein